jgi:hypothetical protein
MDGDLRMFFNRHAAIAIFGGSGAAIAKLVYLPIADKLHLKLADEEINAR